MNVVREPAVLFLADLTTVVFMTDNLRRDKEENL